MSVTNEAQRQQFLNQGCPRCEASRGGPKGLQSHSLTVWCLRCGWSRNWDQVVSWATERARELSR